MTSGDGGGRLSARENRRRPYDRLNLREPARDFDRLESVLGVPQLGPQFGDAKTPGLRLVVVVLNRGLPRFVRFGDCGPVLDEPGMLAREFVVSQFGDGKRLGISHSIRERHGRILDRRFRVVGADLAGRFRVVGAIDRRRVSQDTAARPWLVRRLARCRREVLEA